MQVSRIMVQNRDAMIIHLLMRIYPCPDRCSVLGILWHPDRYLSVSYAIPSIVIAFWSVLFVALGMFTALMIFNRKRFHLDRSHWKFMSLYGFTFAAFHTTWTLSVQYNGAAVATFLVYLSPAMTAMLSRMIFKERFNLIKILSIVLSLVGTVFVSGASDPSAWGSNSLGIVFGLLSAPFFAFYNLEGKYSSDQSIDPWTAVFYCFTFATIFLFIFNIGMDGLSGKPLLSDMLWLGNSAIGWGILLLLGIGLPRLACLGCTQ